MDYGAGVRLVESQLSLGQGLGTLARDQRSLRVYRNDSVDAQTIGSCMTLETHSVVTEWA